METTMEKAIEYFNQEDEELFKAINGSSFIISNNDEYIKPELNKLSWFYEDRCNSIISKIITDNLFLFEALDLTHNKVIEMLCSLKNYKDYIQPKKNDYFIPNDDVVIKRTQTSKAKFDRFLEIIANLNLIDVKFSNGCIVIKLNEDLFNNDKFFIRKQKQFYKKDMKEIFYREEECKSFYRLPYNDRIIKSKFKEAIIGLTLSYAELKIVDYEKIFSNIRYNKQFDKHILMYAECPVHIIARLFHISVDEVIRELDILCKSTDYIAHHDLVYADYKLNKNEHLDKNKSNIEHMNAEDYKVFPLNNYKSIYDYKKVLIEEGHPIVRKTSVILFVDRLLERKVGKNAVKNLNSYSNMILSYLRFNEVAKAKLTINGKSSFISDEHFKLSSNSYKGLLKEHIPSNIIEKSKALGIYYKINPVITNSEKDLFNHSLDNSIANLMEETNDISVNKEQDFINNNILDKENVCATIMSLSNGALFEDLPTNFKRLKLFETVTITDKNGIKKQVRRSVKSLCKFYRYVVNYMQEVPFKDLAYYIKLLQRTKDLIADSLYKSWQSAILKNESQEMYLYNYMINGFIVKKYSMELDSDFYTSIKDALKSKIVESKAYKVIFKNDLQLAFNCGYTDLDIDTSKFTFNGGNFEVEDIEPAYATIEFKEDRLNEIEKEAEEEWNNNKQWSDDLQGYYYFILPYRIDNYKNIEDMLNDSEFPSKENNWWGPNGSRVCFSKEDIIECWKDKDIDTMDHINDITETYIKECFEKRIPNMQEKFKELKYEQNEYYNLNKLEEEQYKEKQLQEKKRKDTAHFTNQLNEEDYNSLDFIEDCSKEVDYNIQYQKDLLDEEYYDYYDED